MDGDYRKTHVEFLGPDGNLAKIYSSKQIDLNVELPTRLQKYELPSNLYSDLLIHLSNYPRHPKREYNLYQTFLLVITKICGADTVASRDVVRELSALKYRLAISSMTLDWYTFLLYLKCSSNIFFPLLAAESCFEERCSGRQSSHKSVLSCCCSS